MGIGVLHAWARVLEKKEHGKRVTYFMDAGTCATHAPLLHMCTHMEHANAPSDTSDRTTTTVQR
jgi:type IV secretory pathway VirD2 relaxase